jgi:hypothetical protein
MLGDLRTVHSINHYYRFMPFGMGLQRGVEPRLKAPQALVLAVTPQQPRNHKQFSDQLKGFRGAAPSNPRARNNTVILGTVRSAFGVGGVAGGLLLSAWGGPKKKVHGVLFGMAFSSLLGFTVLGLAGSVYFWVAGAFIMMAFNPIINGSNQAIWQSKVPPDMQGRVFSARAFIALMSQPIAMTIAGPLADGFLLPGMMEGGSLAPLFGWLMGVGPGEGISLLFLFMGLIGALFGFSAYTVRQVRDVESILPDHDAIGISSEVVVAE